MSIVEEGHPQTIRMAFLAVVGSHTVNGVAGKLNIVPKTVLNISIFLALHSDLLKSVLFKDFVEFYGASKFTNVTNGITPRRCVILMDFFNHL